MFREICKTSDKKTCKVVNLLRWLVLWLKSPPEGVKLQTWLLWGRKSSKSRKVNMTETSEKLPCFSLRCSGDPLIRHEVLPTPRKHCQCSEQWAWSPGSKDKAKVKQDFISDVSVWEVVPAQKVRLTTLWRESKKEAFSYDDWRFLITTYVVIWRYIGWLDCVMTGRWFLHWFSASLWFVPSSWTAP